MKKNPKINFAIARKEYDMTRGIDLPSFITYHKIDDSHLFIAPEKASWISTNAIGKDLMDLLRNGKTIEETILEMEKKEVNKSQIIDELRLLLINIEKKGFHESAVTIEDLENPPTLQVFPTNKCNLRCLHCYMDSGDPKPNELTTDEWAKVIERFSSRFKTDINFSGGEPLILRDIFILTKIAKENGMSVEIFTNGTLIDNEKIVHELEETVDKIQIGFDGATAEAHDYIRGNGAFNRSMKALSLLKDTNIKLRIAFNITPKNIYNLKENIANFVESLSEYKIEFKFGLINTLGRADDSFRFQSGDIGQKETMEVIKILYINKLKTMKKTQPNIVMKNCGYGRTISISSIGDIYGCSVLEHKYGNVRVDDIREIAKNIDKARLTSNVDNIEECSECDVKYLCNGGCRLNNISYNGDLLKAVCSNTKKEEFYRTIITRDTFDPEGIWFRNLQLTL